MPLFLIERNYAEKLELTVDGVSAMSEDQWRDRGQLALLLPECGQAQVLLPLRSEEIPTRSGRPRGVRTCRPT